MSRCSVAYFLLLFFFFHRAQRRGGPSAFLISQHLPRSPQCPMRPPADSSRCAASNCPALHTLQVLFFFFSFLLEKSETHCYRSSKNFSRVTFAVECVTYFYLKTHFAFAGRSERHPRHLVAKRVTTTRKQRPNKERRVLLLKWAFVWHAKISYPRTVLPTRAQSVELDN